MKGMRISVISISGLISRSSDRAISPSGASPASTKLDVSQGKELRMPSLTTTSSSAKNTLYTLRLLFHDRYVEGYAAPLSLLAFDVQALRLGIIQLDALVDVEQAKA